MHLLNFENLLEEEFKSLIIENFPLRWKEDVISHDLAKRLQTNFSQTELEGAQYPVTINWEVYKLFGQPEVDHGDLGILVRYKLLGGALVEGAGFLEAKLRDRKSSQFKQIREEQCKRQLERSPQTRLLLYDYRPAVVLDFPPTASHWSRFPGWFYQRDSRALVSHGPTLPLQLAVALGRYDDSLYRFCNAFSQQFTRRYFNLLDLDFSEKAIQSVKGFPGGLGSPNIVMVIRITEGQVPSEEFQPNNNLYRRME
jgi:hypothetical protein